MGVNTPNTFIQVNLPEVEDKERVCIKITGKLVDWMVDIAPETYKMYFFLKQGRKLLYIIFLKATYSMLEVFMLYYQELKKKLDGHRFKFYPYDACVCN